MKASALQKAWSYFLPLRIERTTSAISGILQIDLVQGRFQLSTGNAVYSFEDKYSSYGKALESAHFQSDLPALVLGLGLGSVPYILAEKYNYSGVITCIDIDPVIIDLASKYYPNMQHWESMHIIQQDAVQFIRENDQKFGLIAMDLFVGDEIPYECWEQPFLLNLKHSLAKDGVLLISRLTERRVEEDIFWKNLALIFPNAEEVHTGGNMILIWNNENSDS